MYSLLQKAKYLIADGVQALLALIDERFCQKLQHFVRPAQRRLVEQGLTIPLHRNTFMGQLVSDEDMCQHIQHHLVQQAGLTVPLCRRIFMGE